MKNLKSLILIVAISIINSTLWAGDDPTADFNLTPGTTIIPGMTVCYTDASSIPLLSDDDITNWDWTFDGQAPDYNATTEATADPPCVTYNTLGSFQTCLDATNPTSTDTHCETINVVPPYNIGSEDGNSINYNCNYFLVDDGGYPGNYGNNQDNTVTLCSSSTDYVFLSLLEIDLVAGDFIEIYDGPSTASPLISTITSADNGSSPTEYSGSSCMTVRFVSNGSGNAEGFLMQLGCTDDIVMSSTQSGNVVNNACGRRITDSGAGGNYSNNENNTVTVCADGVNEVPQIRFTQWGLSSGDHVYFYDGSSTSGELIYSGLPSDGANFLQEGLTVTGLSQCMTIQFTSNGSGTSAGFNGLISCPTPPAGCSGNPPAADNFQAATLICDFTSYCGETSSFYGVDMDFMAQTSNFDGSIENNSWLSFVADGPTASFDVSTIGSCSGIQIGIYSIDASNNVTWLSPASINGGFDYTNMDDGFTGTGVLNAQGMTAGNTYYVMIDGLGGAVCDYSLTAGIGVQLPEAQASADISMTCGDAESVSVVDLNGSTNVDWTWTYTGTSSGGPFAGSSVDVSGLPAGTYTFTVEAQDFSECAATPIQDQVTVTVTCPLPVELVNFDVDCAENGNIVSWMTVSEQNNDYFDLEKSVDGLDFRSLAIVDGAGTTNHTQDYEVRDFEKNNGAVYYRIRQVDMDGTENYSDIISSNDCYTNGFNVLKMYFNQSTSEIVIDYEVTRTTKAYVAMSDLVGRPYLSENITLEPNNNQIRIQANGLAGNTMYILNVSSDNTSDTERIYVNH